MLVRRKSERSKSDDLDDEQKAERIQIIRTVAEVRLGEFQKGTSDGNTPLPDTAPVVLGQPKQRRFATECSVSADAFRCP
jgi:hypothetical protein